MNGTNQGEEGVAFQDNYSDDVAHCYGCCRLNSAGLQVRSFWDSDTEGTIARLLPDEKYTAVPGYVYGGLLASFVDCHGTGTAAGAMARREGAGEQKDLGAQALPRFVTASLQVDYRAPTPMGVELVARGTITEITDRKVITDITVDAGDLTVATGRVVAVRMPEGLVR